MIVGGGLIAAIGAAAAAHGLASYGFGTLARPGSGLFPVAIAVLLVALGLAIAVKGLLSAPWRVHLDWRAMAAVTAAIVSFGVSVRTFGLFPAVFASILVARLADSSLPISRALALAAGVCAAAYLIFVLWLDTAMRVLRWPW